MNSSISPIRLERSQHKSPPRMNTRKSRKDRLNSTPSAARRLFETSSSPNRSPQSEIRKLRKSKKQPMHLKKQELSSMKPLNVKRLPDDLRVEDFYPQDITREDIEKMNDPITLRIFRNPVMINNYDGHTFDLKSITRWVKTNGTNPLTNLPITIKNITPNMARRRLIERALTQYIKRGGKYKRRTDKRQIHTKKLHNRRYYKRTTR